MKFIRANNMEPEKTPARFLRIYKLTRWLLAAVFIYAGAIKLLEPGAFAVVIDAYGIVPEGLLFPVSVILPALEVAAGIGILFDLEGSLGVIFGLLMLFIVILGYGIWIGLDVDCGCFGPGDPEADAFHNLRASLYRDLLMFAGAVFLYAYRRYRNVKPLKIKQITNILQRKRRTQDAYI